MLKERLRWGDPMVHLVKKKHPEMVLPNLGDSEKMKESGFVVPQDIPAHSWLKRGLGAALNRHGIRPGRHWDGVDRSNAPLPIQNFPLLELVSNTCSYVFSRASVCLHILSKPPTKAPSLPTSCSLFTFYILTIHL